MLELKTAKVQGRKSYMLVAGIGSIAIAASIATLAGCEDALRPESPAPQGGVLETVIERNATYRLSVPQQADATIQEDIEELVEATDKIFARPGIPRDEPVEITFSRKHDSVEQEVYQPDASEKDDEGGIGEPLDTFLAFKPVTGNAFLLRIPERVRAAILEYAEANGETEENRGRDSYPGEDILEEIEGDKDAQLAPSQRPTLLGWQYNTDTRSRILSLNTAISSWPLRAIGDSTGNCTGTLIGPRHMVTAAHCIIPFATDDFNVLTYRFGRNGTAWNSQSYLPGCPNSSTTACPNNGTVYWYFVPSQWMNAATTNSEQYDFGLVVLPERRGDQHGWLGTWYAGVSNLNTVNSYNRGYPPCAGFMGSTSRIDDPADPTPCPTCSSQISTCDENHMYGDTNACNVGNETNTGSNGWARNMRMSCSASAGHSGSPLYFYGNGTVGSTVNATYYTGHEISSVCGKTATDTSCASNARPARLVRHNPETAAWISSIKTSFP